ncbi:bifunctional [glutamine synthetase] adenylyltransferase/[glutamine synthetase]-adenylyl-L-tyrosine phosphorylase [Aureimonas psammosilenae]|uniref:bifunctional [glutamine synthetase] adenylyltransferase/[glutamine synthetase]-adenylyl-L-tyrosine phosphorylase n=1 Tax=Aureimonas psammosilenae TaxID=2495496 RepID=UPI001F3BBB3E|nr:bifunctional [glutamine synthetase] adenylyltransferase/[glutamine synthetase]-adenylyl-L-tyrosine phosphorylase [Aureimonas psammosilenae]
MSQARDPSQPEANRAALRIGGALEPRALDPAKAEAWLADLAKGAEAEGYGRLANFCREGADRHRLGAVLDLSPYLNAAMLRRPDWLERLFDEDAQTRIAAIVAHLDSLPEEGASEAATMTALREAKLEASLLIALRDLFGAADARQTTADLSRLAESAIRAALRFLLRDLVRRGQLAVSPERPEEGCGLFVLGMGKLGAGELNYSSDIDLVVFFEPDAPAILDKDESVETFSRLVRRLVRLLNDRTGDGYVFRTDLRLRPDPSAMPLAIPLPAALSYYEASGRNWERAAMIKARCVAGDEAAAAGFLKEIAPFVWRRYLDFNAVSEIQSMKQRIDRHRGLGHVAVAGHNVKLGSGGIREVEFFAQGQQLIAGGRAPALRARRTEDALAALAEGGWVTAETRDELTEAYWFLRRAEHAIQMVADEQSHELPEDEAGLSRIAGLLSFRDLAEFSHELTRRLHLVEGHFDRLFAADGAEPAERKLLAFAENGDVEALARELGAYGFARPDGSARILAGWNEGRLRAMRSEGARRHLAAILPDLLRSLSAAPDPDAALVAFDAFLSGLPAGLQLFSLLSTNRGVLDLLTLIVTAAPSLAATIANRPHVFDALLDPGFFRVQPTRALLEERLGAFLKESRGFEDRLARLRLFASEQRFLVGTRLLSGTMVGTDAGFAFSEIADVTIAEVLDAVSAELAERHGRVPGGRIALFGMGRLGSRELTAGSDVDLILFYDHPEEVDESNGEKPMPVAAYHARLTQRLIAALTAPMGEGVLYEVDFRLRPSGNKGPLATHLDAFRRYQAGEARTWERMALTRSRQIAGDRTFGKEVEGVIREVLACHREDAATATDVAAMRALIEREKPARGPLDLKLRPGGLIDLEFLAQWALMTGRAEPDLIGRPTAEVLDGAGLADLGHAMRRFTDVIQVLRLGPDGVFDFPGLPNRLAALLAETLQAPDAVDAERRIEATAGAVRSDFRDLLPAP